MCVLLEFRKKDLLQKITKARLSIEGNVDDDEVDVGDMIEELLIDREIDDDDDVSCDVDDERRKRARIDACNYLYT